MATTPGWYVDQSDSTHEIYWDGTAWTTARRAVTESHPESGSTPTEPGHQPLPEKPAPWQRLDRDKLAIASDSYPPTPPSRARRRWAIPLGAGVAGVFVGMILGGLGVGAIGAINESNEKAAVAAAAGAEEAALVKIFPAAVDDCNADPTFAVVSDGNRTLTIDNEGQDDFGGLSSLELWCIIEELKTPTAVVSHMEQTTSLDGRQTESWDNIEVSWSYHPDRGMDAVFTIAE